MARMRRVVLLLMLTIATGLAGCPAPPSPTNPADGTADPSPAAPVMPGPINGDKPRAGAGKPKRYKIVVTIRLTTVEVPVGTASGSEEIWSYLDEETVQARAGNLGRNGFRVGLGAEGTWPDLVGVLKRMTGRAPKQNLIATVPGSPLPIVLKDKRTPETIFTFHGDRTLSGRDYPPGDYLLAIVCTLDEDDLSKVLLVAMPQIRSAHSRKTFAMRKAGPEIVVKNDIHDFPPLTFRLRIPAKGFLVIGPGAHARNPTSPGYHFLVKKRQGMEFETLLVLVPEVFATPLK